VADTATCMAHEIMSDMTEDQPCETVRIGYDDVILCRGLSWPGVPFADRMTVQDIRTSEQRDVVIFLASEGRIIQGVMVFGSWTVETDNVLADLPEEEQKRLLAIYDRLPNRSFK
jgi:hypothetical protein